MGVKVTFIPRFTGYEVVGPKEEYSLRMNPEFIPIEQLLFAFIGIRKGQLIFLDLEPKRKKRKRKR